MSWSLFLDESGDLGFDFTKNPSSFLTVSVLAVSNAQTAKAIRCAVSKTLGRKVNRRKRTPEHELKGYRTDLPTKEYFYRQVADEDFGVYAVSMDKRLVLAELCKDPASKDRLYTTVAKTVIERIPIDGAAGAVQLVVDKSKGKAGIAEFNEALEAQLRSKVGDRGKVTIYHTDSTRDRGLSAADLFSWGIYRKYERDDTDWFDVFADKVRLDERYQ
ncbi:MAG: DUF3800 domain-containing protein [Pirellulales bacterium]|nr:DUF3800 domain-containing protein [Pirellulales bacterium]